MTAEAAKLLEAHNAREREGAPDRYGVWMRVNCIIDPRDDIFHFFASHPIASNPVREYLADGWRTLSELMVLMDAVQRPLGRTASMLEFAAGFGRFTRHLAPLLPGRLTVSDIHPGSVDFLRGELGVEGFYSTHDPQRLEIPGRYDLVFVLSMFTHLPPAMWGPWLRKLFAALEPGGYLVFTVHNEAMAALEGVKFGADGTFFAASSESRELSAETYGTTFTTRAFVEREVERALGRPVTLFRDVAFWHGQAAVLVQA
jgi:SAM-dependent methyltransferase